MTWPLANSLNHKNGHDGTEHAPLGHHGDARALEQQHAQHAQQLAHVPRFRALQAAAHLLRKMKEARQKQEVEDVKFNLVRKVGSYVDLAWTPGATP